MDADWSGLISTNHPGTYTFLKTKSILKYSNVLQQTTGSKEEMKEGWVGATIYILGSRNEGRQDACMAIPTGTTREKISGPGAQDAHTYSNHSEKNSLLQYKMLILLQSSSILCTE